MVDLWSTLLALVLGSAVSPTQIVVTILLLRSKYGVGAAARWVAGMTFTRVVQGAFFGVVLASSPDTTPDTTTGTRTGPSVFTSTLLLVMAVVFLVTSIRQLLKHPAEDAPHPRWMSLVESMRPRRALLAGAGYPAVSTKLWIITLGAVGAISDAHLGGISAALVFALFVVLAQSIEFVLLGIAVIVPDRSDALLGSLQTWVTDHTRIFMIVLGLVFGAFFLVRSLHGLGVW